MQLLALAIALATSICGVQAQNPGDNDFRQRWFLNVTVGGVFDEIPQCAVRLHYSPFLFTFAVSQTISMLFPFPADIVTSRRKHALSDILK